MARPKRDPLIAAMIAKLPQDSEWPEDRQLAWLHLMAMAFGTVYGGNAAAHLGGTKPSEKAAVRPVEKPQAAYPFYIDEAGAVRRGDGTPVKPKDVKGDLYDLRGQDGDMKTIQWADGSMGLNGADLTIIAV